MKRLNNRDALTPLLYTVTGEILFYKVNKVLVFLNFLIYLILINQSDDVKSLSLPGTYHEKITSMGNSLRSFTRLKHLDVSRNALTSSEVCTAPNT